MTNEYIHLSILIYEYTYGRAVKIFTVDQGSRGPLCTLYKVAQNLAYCVSSTASITVQFDGGGPHGRHAYASG